MPILPSGYRQVASGRLVLLRPDYNRPLVNAKDFSKIKKRYNVNDTLLQKAVSDNPSIELFLKRYPDAAPVFSQFVPRPQKMKIIAQLESVVPSDEASNIEFLKRVVETFPMSFPVISAESMMSQLTPAEADLFKSQGVVGFLNSASAGGSTLEEAIRELTQTLHERGVPPDSISSISDAVSGSSSMAPRLATLEHGRTRPRVSVVTLTPDVRMGERLPEDEMEGDEGPTEEAGEGPEDRYDDYLQDFLEKEFVKSKEEEPKLEQRASAVADPHIHRVSLRGILRKTPVPAATPRPSSRRRGDDDRDSDDKPAGRGGASAKPAEKASDKPAEKASDKPAEKASDKPAEKASAKPAEKASAKSAEKAGASAKSAEKESDEDAEKADAKSVEKESDEDEVGATLLYLAQSLDAAYNPPRGSPKIDQKVLEMRDEFVDRLYKFMTTPGSGRADLTPTQAKKLYDVAKNGIIFPKDKLSKKQPILDRLEGLRK